MSHGTAAQISRVRTDLFDGRPCLADSRPLELQPGRVELRPSGELVIERTRRDHHRGGDLVGVDRRPADERASVDVADLVLGADCLVARVVADFEEKAYR